MLKFVFIRSCLLLGVVGLLFSAWLSWTNDQLVYQIKELGAVESVQRLNRSDVPIFVTEPIKLLLNRMSREADVDNREALDLIDVYLVRRPLDASAWLLASKFYQRGGDIDSASNALAVAHRLSETNTTLLLNVFNRYLEMGFVEQALPVAHDIVVAKPYEFRRLFYLAWRLNGDYEQVANQVIPRNSDVISLSKAGLDSDVYFNWALNDAIKVGNTELAQAVWLAMPVQFKRHSELGLAYVDYLVGLQDLELLKPVWLDVVGSQMELGQLVNAAGSMLSPCWNEQKINGIETVIESVGGDALIRLNFLGERNIGYAHLSCIVQVQPGAQYVLKGRYKGSDITTLSGPFIDAFFPNTDSIYKSSESLVGDWPWKDFQIKLDVPSDAHFVKIRVRRNKTEFLDSKISGSVWFDRIRLERSDQNIRTELR